MSYFGAIRFMVCAIVRLCTGRGDFLRYFSLFSINKLKSIPPKPVDVSVTTSMLMYAVPYCIVFCTISLIAGVIVEEMVSKSGTLVNSIIAVLVLMIISISVGAVLVMFLSKHNKEWSCVLYLGLSEFMCILFAISSIGLNMHIVFDVLFNRGVNILVFDITNFGVIALTSFMFLSSLMQAVPVSEYMNDDSSCVSTD